MRYIAKHYVTISGRMFTPGEVIHIPIPDEKLPRLLKLGAVIPNPAAYSANGGKANIEKKAGEEKAREDAQQNYAAQLHGLGYAPDGNPLPAPEETDDDTADDDTGDGEVAEVTDDEEDANDETEDEADDEAVAPEIDVMDGIVPASDETAERVPVKKNTRGRKKA